MITDKRTDELLAQLAEVPTATENRLWDLMDDAAKEFAALTLWADQPVEDQGLTDQRAWAVRDQRRRASRKVWLAVKAEVSRRRRVTADPCPVRTTS